jgi:hypothetical protein
MVQTILSAKNQKPFLVFVEYSLSFIFLLRMELRPFLKKAKKLFYHSNHS